MTTVTPKALPFLEINRDDGKLIRRFHEGQTRAWASEAKVVAMICGTQVGKTCFGPHWLKREIERCGPGDYLAITATYPLLKLKMLPEFLYAFETLFKLGTWKHSDKVFLSHEKYHGAEAFRVVFGSATNPESIESATALAAWLDECGQDQFKLEAWEATERRLSLSEGRMLCTTTPYNWGWFKRKVYDPWKEGDDRFDVIQLDSIMNPAFPQAEYDRARRTLPRWKFNLFYRGLFDKPAGLIYDCFDEDTCCIQRFKLSKDWPRYVGHDFGPNNTAAVWYAQDPSTGYLYVYRTYRAGNLSAYDHAQEYKRLSEGENILKRVGGASHEDGWRESFTAAGWPISKPREREVEIGINRVYGWHKTNKLFVFKDVVDYLAEKESYSRKLDDNFEPTKEIADKSRFHLMDCPIWGTLVTTSKGPIPIQDIQDGDMVATRQGYRSVSICGQTSSSREVFEAHFSDGTVITATPEHPFWVSNKDQWVPLIDLRYGDIMETWKVRQLPSIVSRIIDIPSRYADQIEFTSRGRGKLFTGRSGKILTDLYRQVASSITETVTRWTTLWKIWPSLPVLSTYPATRESESTTSNILPESDHWLLNGIHLRKGSNGILSMGGRLWLVWNSCQRFVFSVAATSWLKVGEQRIASVLTHAKSALGERLGKITNYALVQFAKLHILSTNMLGLGRAQGNVVRFVELRPIGNATVYNLKVSEVPEYYANGILVHNCERYILSDFSPESVPGQRLKIYEVMA